jgi:hypothetical protein
VPTFTGFSTPPTVTACRYTVIGKTCIMYFRGLAGTSNATTYTMTLPFAAAANLQFFLGPATDNSAGLSTPGMLRTKASSNIADLLKDPIGNAWTASGTKLWQGTVTFEML